MARDSPIRAPFHTSDEEGDDASRRPILVDNPLRRDTESTTDSLGDLPSAKAVLEGIPEPKGSGLHSGAKSLTAVSSSGPKGCSYR